MTTPKPSLRRRVTITILPTLDDMLERLVSETGKSKSALIEGAVKQFVQNQLEKDTAALGKLTAMDLPSEDDWLMLQNETLNT